MASPLALALVALSVLAVSWLWDSVVVHLVWRPYAIAKKLREQGIHGPRYKFLKGSKEEVKRMKEAAGFVLDVHDHDDLPRIAPHFLKWRTHYGEPFLYWFGAKPRICVFDYEIIRAVSVLAVWVYGASNGAPLLGVRVNGAKMITEDLISISLVLIASHSSMLDPEGEETNEHMNSTYGWQNNKALNTPEDDRGKGNMTVGKLMEAYESCIAKLRKSQTNRRKISLKKVEEANFTKEVRRQVPEAILKKIISLNSLDIELYEHAKNIFMQEHLMLKGQHSIDGQHKKLADQKGWIQSVTPGVALPGRSLRLVLGSL